MDWSIDSARPIWIQLSEQLTRRIVSGQYPMGARLPSVRELAEEAGVNPNTMQKAMAELERTGLRTWRIRGWPWARAPRAEASPRTRKKSAPSAWSLPGRVGRAM